MAVGDVGFLALQADRNRLGQDIEQQAIRQVFLQRHRFALRINDFAQLGFFARKIPEQRIDHRRDGNKIKYKKYRHRALVELLDVELQGVIEHAGEGRHENVGNEPRHRLARAKDDDGANGRQ